MCKTKVQTNFYYDEARKCEHKKNITKLWCKIIFQTNVEQIERLALFVVLWGVNSNKLP